VEIVLPRRFRGPIDSANGGYTCGRLAAFLDADVAEVTLRRPPPLERRLEVRRDSGAVVLVDGDVPIAEARATELRLDPPDPVSFDEAEAAARRHVRTGNPAFRECFSCGVREEGDGLAIHAGPVAGREPLHAAPWTVGETGPEIIWAAIDCSGAYAVGAAGRGDVVLGRMAARLVRLPEVGERCAVAAWPLGEDGRKRYAGTALFSASGDLLAESRQTWIEPLSDSK
jgi:hypothetical protein